MCNLKTDCKYCGKEIVKSGISAHYRGHENLLNEKYKCNDCDKAFSTSQVLKIHLESVHADKTGVICPKCSKQLGHKHTLKSHLKICQTNIQLKCEICNRAFKTPSGVRNHKMSEHSNEYNFQCELCEDRFKIKENLQRHIKVNHAPKGSYQCPHCRKPYEVKFMLTKHSKICRKGPRGQKIFQCDLCLKNFRSAEAVKRHKNSFHEGLRNFACTECDKTYTDHTPLRKHIQTAHTEKGSFECKECKKTFDKAVKLDAHNYRSHVTKDDKIECRFCKKSMHKYSIKEHEQAHIDFAAQKFKCEKCSRVFSRGFEYKNHVRKHEKADNNEVENHPCDQCGKSFKQRGYLLKHINYIHRKSEAGKWKCEPCNKEFAQYGSLHIHKKRIHLGKRFPCSLCDTVAKDETELTDHINKKHNNPFKECPICQKVVASASLSSHKKTHLKEKPHKCNFCGVTVTFKSNLKKHIERAHLGIKDKQVKCDECGAMVRNLKVHYKNIHQQKDMYACTSCDFKTNTLTYLNAHKKRMHQDSKLQCDLCTFTTKDLRGLEDHKNNIHFVHHQGTTHQR